MTDQDTFEQLSRALSQLTAAVSNMSLYSPKHPQVASYIDKVHDSLTALLQVKPELTLLMIEETLVADNRQLTFAGSYGPAFIKILKKKGVERITFLAGLPRAHLERLIQDLASPDPKKIESSSCIRLGRVKLEDKKGDDSEGKDGKKTLDEETQEFIQFRERQLVQMHDLYHSIELRKRIDMQIVQAIVGEFVHRFRREMNPLSLLASLKSHDEYTFVHATNVGLLVMCQAEALGFKGAYLHDIGVAGLLHDVGKLIIPEEIVGKPGALTAEERQIMEKHAALGAQYLVTQKNVPKLALLGALEHHVKYDGTGYPAIPGSWRPHIVSQMITVGDVFDAMRSRRPYRDAMPMDEIVKVFHRESGKLFNPVLAKFFLQLIEC